MDASSESFELRHARVLAFVVPAICHRLSNVVSVTTGMVELGLLSPSSESLAENLALALEHSSKAGRQIKRLGSFAHLTEDAPVSEDGARSAEDAAELLQPICNVTRTSFVHRATDRVFPVVTDRKRLMQLVMIVSCSPLLSGGSAALGHDGGIESMRLSIVPSQSGAAIRLTVKGGSAIQAESTASLLADSARAINARLSTRTIGETTSFRIALVAPAN